MPQPPITYIDMNKFVFVEANFVYFQYIPRNMYIFNTFYQNACPNLLFVLG